MAMFAAGLTLIPMQNLLLFLACREVGIDPTIYLAECRQSAEANKLAVTWSNNVTLAGSVPQVIAILLAGVLMDKVGRKPFIVLNAFGTLLGVFTAILLALGAPLMLAYISSFLFSGFGPAGIVVAGYAYISDTSDAASRGRNFALTDSCLVVSVLIAPVISGALSSYLGGVMVPFSVSVLLLIISIIWVTVFVPESLRTSVPESFVTVPTVDYGAVSSERDAEPEENAAPVPSPSRKTATPSLLETIGTGLMDSITMMSQGPLFLMTLIHILHVFIAGGTMAFILYFISLRFGWGETQQGTFLLVAALIRMVNLTVVLPAFISMFENGVQGRTRTMRERTVFEFKLIVVAMIMFGIGHSSIAFLTEGWQLYLVIIFEGFTALLSPIPKSLLSKAVPENSQGKLMAALSFLDNVFGTLGGLFGAFICAALLLCGLVAMINVILIALIDKNRLSDHIEEVQRLDALAARAGGSDDSPIEENGNGEVVFSVKRRGSAETLNAEA
ncbi:hypothetical protein HDU67_004566 [Dinochytrium kinnereticum]|nr:hypothetical protein HDU67_004566 [Dinochytrium kinnereticum]